jgi:uncharacterized iron-regulated membrane protein
MTIRKIFFWLHLSVGTVTGSVILVMCMTGAALGFEKQIVLWAQRHERTVAATSGAQRLPMEPLLVQALKRESDQPASLTWRSEANSTVELVYGRGRTVFLNPYNGQGLEDSAVKLRAFFDLAENVHRWLGVGGANRQSARAIIGAANLLFLFLACSGIYLWWPRKWTWNTLKTGTTFRRGLAGRARDINWHNTIGFWICLPLVVIVICSTVMSYQWANNLVYRLSGSPVPPANAAPRLAEVQTGPPEKLKVEGLDALRALAEKKVPEWQSITMRLSGGKSANVSFQIDAGDGRRPDKRAQLTLNRETGDEVRWEPFSGNTRGRKIRAWMRFAHTGEAGGLLGQSVASAASLGGVFLACTGIALAIRRFLALRSKAKPSHFKRTQN